jgi:hypothetical protein
LTGRGETGESWDAQNKNASQLKLGGAFASQGKKSRKKKRLKKKATEQVPTL